MQKKEFSNRSLRFRRQHNEAVQALYGENPNTGFKPPKKRAKRRSTNPPPEYQLQTKLVAWARSEGLELISIPNSGRRSWAEGKRQVAMGLTAGVSDLFLAHTQMGYGGFWIELKAPGKRPTGEQLGWLKRMDIRGYKTGWFDNLELAQKAIMDYIYMA